MYTSRFTNDRNVKPVPVIKVHQVLLCDPFVTLYISQQSKHTTIHSLADRLCNRNHRHRRHKDHILHKKSTVDLGVYRIVLSWPIHLPGQYSPRILITEIFTLKMEAAWTSKMLVPTGALHDVTTQKTMT